MTKRHICFIRSGRVKTIDGLFHHLHEHFSKEFEHLFFVNVSNVFTSRFIGDHDDDDVRSILPANLTYLVPKNLSEFKKFLISHNLVVICYFSETWPDWWIHHYLRKYSIPLVYIHTHSIIVRFQYNSAVKENFSIRLWNKARTLYSRFLRYVGLRYFLSNVDTLFISRKDKAERIKSNSSGRYRRSEIVITNSRFYDSFLLNDYVPSNDCVVFLDSVLPYTEDQTRFGHQPIGRELYYKNLNKVLKLIGTTLGKEVVVCLHPKYNDDNLQEDYGNLKTVKYRTDEFIAKAEVVLFHETTAINTAVLYNKKIVQLTGSRFNDFTKNNCKVLQELFSFPTLDIFEGDEGHIRETVKSLELNKEEYDAYISNCVIASGEKEIPSCAQIAEHISRKYSIHSYAGTFDADN